MPWRPRSEPKKGIGTCWGCGNQLPGPLLHEHHRTPRAAGGGDEQSNKVLICPLCHTAVHAITKVFVKGRTGEVRDLINQLTKGDRGFGRRIMELVQVEARAWQTGERSDYQRVTFNLQRSVYEVLKGLANSKINPQTRRPMGVGRLIETILTKWVEAQCRLQAKDLKREEGPRTPTMRGRPEIEPKET